MFKLPIKACLSNLCFPNRNYRYETLIFSYCANKVSNYCLTYINTFSLNGSFKDIDNLRINSLALISVCKAELVNSNYFINKEEITCSLDELEKFRESFNSLLLSITDFNTQNFKGSLTNARKGQDISKKLSQKSPISSMPLCFDKLLLILESDYLSKIYPND